MCGRSTRRCPTATPSCRTTCVCQARRGSSWALTNNPRTSHRRRPRCEILDESIFPRRETYFVLLLWRTTLLSRAFTVVAVLSRRRHYTMNSRSRAPKRRWQYERIAVFACTRCCGHGSCWLLGHFLYVHDQGGREGVLLRARARQEMPCVSGRDSAGYCHRSPPPFWSDRSKLCISSDVEIRS